MSPDPTCTADRHGRPTDYCKRHCRCPEAREAWRIYNKRRREGRHTPITQYIDGLGTRRRLQALAALGYSLTGAIPRHLGANRQAARHYLAGDNVTPATAEAVRTLYERLSMAVPPPGISRTKARNHARAQGWAPPLAWDDIDDPQERPDIGRKPRAHLLPVDRVVVHRLATGRPVPSTLAERKAAVDLLLSSGVSALATARVLGVSDRSVERHKRRTETAAA